ncbi:MAG: hypothetical protein NNA25_05190 [Nitrospira sp.]|nr:hypothetical protein [Nitrospira sp.]
MRSIGFIIIAVGIVLALGEDGGPAAYAKTIEAGDSSSSWSGTGEFMELGDGEQVVDGINGIMGIVKGVLISRHRDGGKMIVHSSKLACPVRVNLNGTKDFQAMNGLCTIVAHQGKDIASASFKCTGNLKECEGEFTLTGGAGGFTGISATTPFQTSIVFELQEGKTGQAIGYAVWPNLTYTLPSRSSLPVPIRFQEEELPSNKRKKLPPHKHIATSVTV